MQNSHFGFFRIVSLIFHPTVGMLFIFCLLFACFPEVLPNDFESRITLVLAVLFLTFVLPSLLILMLYRLGYVQDLGLDNRKDRGMPFFVTFACYLVLTFICRRVLPVDAVIPHIVSASVWVLIVIFFVNAFFGKISVHTASMGGVFGTLLALQAIYYGESTLFWLLVTTLAGGLTISSRIALNAHTASQAYVGWLVGFGVQFGYILFF